jgi:hypothetical protein
MISQIHYFHILLWSFLLHHKPIHITLLCLLILPLPATYWSFGSHHQWLSYNARGVRSYRRCLLSQQRLLRHLIGLLGCDFLVSFTIKNYPTWRQVQFLVELIELRTIINGDLHSVVSSGRNHVYVGGLTLISWPLPSYQAVVAAVRAALRDREHRCATTRNSGLEWLHHLHPPLHHKTWSMNGSVMSAILPTRHPLLLLSFVITATGSMKSDQESVYVLCCTSHNTIT